MENCIDIYNQFLENVQTLTKNKTTEYKDNVEDRLSRFYKSLQNEDTFALFCMTKIKVFSAKTEETYDVSSSLFGEGLTLKHIFNNQTEEVKNKLWELLLHLYTQLEKVNNNKQERLALIKDSLKKMRSASTQNIKNNIFKNVLKTDVNSTTNNMLEDIIGSFQSATSNKSNPFENIMGITEMITNKYGSKIETGEIELDKILGGMGNLFNGGAGGGMGGLGGMPGMGGLAGMGDLAKMFGGGAEEEDKPVIMDDNFSTADVEVGKEEDEEEKGGINLKKLMPLASMMNKIGSIKSTDDVNNLKKEMDNFMEKELKVDMNEYKETISKLEQKLEEAKTKATEDLD